MGCVPTKKKTNFTEDKSKKIKLVILPGTFAKLNDQKFTDVYNIGTKVGSGAYAQVNLCTKKFQHQAETRAVKIISKLMFESEDLKNQFIMEIQILKKLDHPNIIRTYEFFEDNDNFYIVMEYCKGGELFDEILKQKQFSEYEAALIIRQVFSCIAYLHSKKIIHRDIKPENLLLEEKDDVFNIKLIDFGIAIINEGEGVVGMIGTTSYIAPEVISGKYTEKCDVWSAGVILYILLSGFPPFQGSNKEEVYSMIQNCTYILDRYGWENISNDAKDLIKKTMVAEKHRITAEKALQHKWITCNHKKANKSLENAKSVLDQLIDFSSENALQDAAKLFIITQLMSSREIKKVKDIFQELDENGDGKLSREELIKGYRRFLNAKNAETIADNILRKVDTDNNGYIDYNEFLKAAIDMKSVATTDYLQGAFNLFDRDGNGKISIEELKAVLQSGDENANELEEIIKQVDVNNDGEIDINEFTLILQKMKAD